MANLTARFQMIDEMSQKMADLAAGGQTMLDKWESAGDAASAAMDAIVLCIVCRYCCRRRGYIH